MAESDVRAVEHGIDINAPTRAVYRLIAEIENWSWLFPPTIYADYLVPGDRNQRIRIWATAGDTVKNWTSRRTLDQERLRVDFRQEVSSPPIASMGGTWIIEALGSQRSRVRLLHDYRATEPERLDWIDTVVDRNSRSELEALRSGAELGEGTTDVAFSFEDTVFLNGRAEDAFDFINLARLWPKRLPHVADVQFDEPSPGLQSLQMDTVAVDGSTHRTKSYRVTFPHQKIVYKQITLPALMNVHTGCWTVRPGDAGVVVSSQHTVVLNTDKIPAVLGTDATVADARAYVQNALSTNSTATLNHAKRYAEELR